MWQGIKGWFGRLFRRKEPETVEFEMPTWGVSSETGDFAIGDTQAYKLGADQQEVEELRPEDSEPWAHPFVAPSMDVDLCQAQLTRSIRSELELVNEPKNVAFLTRLLKFVEQEKIELPPFPGIALELDQVLNSPEPSMQQVINLIEQDPALVHRVWARSQGVHYMTPADSLHSAIMRIGFDDLWQVAMSVCLYSAVFRVRGFQNEVEDIRLHGVVAADVVAWMAGQQRGSYYLAGLLHDVGKLLIYRSASVRSRKERPSIGLLNQVVRRHHAALGVLVANAWELDETVAAAAGFHHQPSRAPEEFQLDARMMQVADIAAHAAVSGTTVRVRLAEAALQNLGDADIDAMGALERARDAYSRLSMDLASKGT